MFGQKREVREEFNWFGHGTPYLTKRTRSNLEDSQMLASSNPRFNIHGPPWVQNKQTHLKECDATGLGPESAISACFMSLLSRCWLEKMCLSGLLRTDWYRIVCGSIRDFN